MELKILSRRSTLAKVQAREVAQLIQDDHGITCQLEDMDSEGDLKLEQNLPEIGGKGLFTAALEKRLLQGSADLAVHSLKDMPTESDPDLTIAAIPEAVSPLDCFLSYQYESWQDLPEQATVGTSSPRRVAALQSLRDDLKTLPIRGNIQTRLQKLKDGQADGLVMAQAALQRLNINPGDGLHIQPFTLKEMVPAPGQGALAVQIASHREEVQTLLNSIHDEDSAERTQLERQLLNITGGGCHSPLGVFVDLEDEQVWIQGLPHPGSIAEYSLAEVKADPEAFVAKLKA